MLVQEAALLLVVTCVLQDVLQHVYPAARIGVLLLLVTMAARLYAVVVLVVVAVQVLVEHFVLLGVVEVAVMY